MTKSCSVVKILTVILLACSGTQALADLDEEEFGGYLPGDLGGQKGWFVTVKDLGHPEGAQIVEGDAARQFVELVGLKDEGGGSSRMVKKFPPTSGSFVAIKVDFAPGDESIDGGLYFEQESVSNLLALSFQKGTLRVLCFNGEVSSETGLSKLAEIDTGVQFDPLKTNKLEIWLSLEKHNFQVFLNGNSCGEFPLPESVDAVDLVNFYGGGREVVSKLEGLSIVSVTKFPRKPHAK